MSDKYILSKFTKQFKAAEQAIAGSSQEDESGHDQGSKHGHNSDKLSYIQFKDFMTKFGLLTAEQAAFNCLENMLVFDIWELIAPRLERDLTNIDADDSPLNVTDVT